jgi:hypothetical protein
MQWMNILIILGCLAGGYWLVSSILGPGIDVNRRGKPDEKPAAPGADSGSATRTASDAHIRAHAHDWHLILDVPANAGRREIEAAFKRRLAKAESSGDSFESIRLRRAHEAALQQVKS